MKIMIASGTDSGIKRVRSELINELLNNNHDIIVATPQTGAHKDLLQMGCKLQKVDVDRHGKNVRSDFKLFIQFLAVLKKEKPNVLLTFTTKPNIYCASAARILHIPLIMNITGMGSALSKPGKMQKMLIKMYQFATGGENTKCIFFQNDDSKDFFVKNRIGDTACYKRIPGSGVNLDKFTVLPYPKERKINFLFVARVMKEKGIEEFVEAAKIIKQKYDYVFFHVLGACDQDYSEYLNNAVQQQIIKYHGQVSNIIDFQALSVATIHPSYYPEGMSNVILEAAACGRPVITTDHPGCREGVEDGKTGFIVPIKDIDSLVNAIEAIIRMNCEERKQMGLNGRKKIEREFDRQIVTNAYLKEISNITIQ